MSYGEQLQTAAAALARAYAALRAGPPSSDERASAAVSRARLYHSIERQIVVLGNVGLADLPPVGDVPGPNRPSVTGRNPVAALATGLRHAPAGTLAANRLSRIDPPAAGTVAVALREAYQAMQTAGDILISNTGAQTRPGERHLPLTTEGMALLAGLGRSDNLAALAKLAAAAAAMDVRLTRWMWPEEAPAELQPLLAAAEQDAWQTKSSPLHETALLVAADGDAQRAPVLGMAVAPPVDDPRRWSQVTSGPDCVEAIDAARSWLMRRGDQLTVGQLAGTARAALAITHYVGHVHVCLGSADSGVSTAVTLAARPWRGVLQAAAELRSPASERADHSTLTVAVAGVAAWLGSQLRPGGQWRGPTSWARDPADHAAWETIAGQINARMPDLADLLHQAIRAVHSRGGVLAATGRLSPRSGRLVHAPEWQPVPAENRSYRAVGKALGNAAKHGRELAAAVGVQPRPGLSDVPAASRGTYDVPARPVRLAGQWYPQRGGMAEPATPPPTTVGRPSGRQPRPAQRPRRGPSR